MPSAKVGDLSVDCSGGGPLTREVSISYDPGTAVIAPILTGNLIFLGPAMGTYRFIDDFDEEKTILIKIQQSDDT